MRGVKCKADFFGRAVAGLLIVRKGFAAGGLLASMRRWWCRKMGAIRANSLE
jgi:hypothetical protein